MSFINGYTSSVEIYGFPKNTPSVKGYGECSTGDIKVNVIEPHGPK